MVRVCLVMHVCAPRRAQPWPRREKFRPVAHRIAVLAADALGTGGQPSRAGRGHRNVAVMVSMGALLVAYGPGDGTLPHIAEPTKVTSAGERLSGTTLPRKGWARFDDPNGPSRVVKGELGAGP